MTILGIWENWESMNILDSLLVAFIAIVIVFLVLIILIFICSVFQKSMDKIDSLTHILPKDENRILSEDEDAVVATIVASIDFNKETGKEPEVIRVERIEG